MEKFCYACGKKEAADSPLIEGLCQKCFAEKHQMLALPKKIVVAICRRCRRYFWKGAWRNPSGDRDEDIVKDVVLQAASFVNLIDGEKVLTPLCSADVEASVVPHLKAGVVEIEVRGKIHKNQTETKIERAKIKAEVLHRLCKTCSLRAAGKHEAILQLRGLQGDEQMEEAAKILLEVIATMERENPQDFLAKVEREGGGINFYLGSLNLGKRLSELLRKSGGKVTTTTKLIGQTKDGRKKYTVTILARISEESMKMLLKHSRFKGVKR
ncbi:MAG: NMD3-related protein [Candidatus Hadarchaeales archaeon]